MKTLPTNIETEAPTIQPKVVESSDCANILLIKGIEFAESGQYLIVGNITQIKGWTLHVSVIYTEYTKLLTSLLPILTEANIPFSIPKNKDAVRLIQNGGIGNQSIGKIISIYSNKPDSLASIAQNLITLTKGFRGPRVPSSISLGGCVYTQFEALNDSANSKPKLAAVIDHERVWPFNEIMSFPKPSKKPLWNNRYRALGTIKLDPKGRVIQANYFKSIFNIKLCIIKEGVKNMWADEFGRDIVDRIKWQYDLYSRLDGYVTTPRIFDYFEEEGNVYLTIDFIKGDSLHFKATSIYAGDSWYQLSLESQLCLIEFALKTVYIVAKLHSLGYVHRDITPSNFIVDKHGNFHLIDMELTYSTHDHRPSPPFKLGTPGYMSPEQMNAQIPTEKEDIYALGALMIFLFCGISPSDIDVSNIDGLLGHLVHFTDRSLACLIIQCLSAEASNRPDIETIAEVLVNHKRNLGKPNAKLSPQNSVSIDRGEIDSIIYAGFETLKATDFLSKERIWISNENTNSSKLGDYSQLNLQVGIAGILYTVGKAASLGYNINPYRKICQRNYEHLCNQDFVSKQMNNSGLLNGTAGIALCIHQANIGGVVANYDRGHLDMLFDHLIYGRMDIGAGIAGQGLALIKCRDHLTSAVYESKLDSVINTIIIKQETNGSWKTSNNRGRDRTNLSLVSGIAGILAFLTIYCRLYRNTRVLMSLEKGLNWLANKTKEENTLWLQLRKNSTNTADRISSASGIPGIALTFLKAYELLNDPKLKSTAENLLVRLPIQALPQDYTQIHGLSGLGEVYLDAHTILKADEWGERLNWVIKCFVHTFQRKTSIAAWPVDAQFGSPNSLMIGTSGILHFLMRTQFPDNSGHILLGE